MTEGFVRPERTDVNRGFWERVDEGVLTAQRCAGCGELRYPPASHCPVCLRGEWSWQPLSGRGELLSYVVVHQRYHAAWADRLPYNVALVQLDEGPRMISNVLPLDRQDLQVGMRLRVVFDDEGGVRLPRFVGVGEEGNR